MENILEKLDETSLKLLRHIAALAQKHRWPVYVVGGCVRDLSLGRSLVDLDIVVEGDGIALAHDFSLSVNGRLTAYAQFRTATVRLPDGQAIDFVSARQERYPHPGALPVVSPGTINEDLFRRDFTVNAMAVRISSEDFGELVDPYQGMADLKKKTIRILHDRSFEDDATRILRAVRFEQRFGFRLEPKTVRLLKQALVGKFETTIKPQRYFEEFKKNLQEQQVLDNLKRLSGLHALDFLGFALRFNHRRNALARNISSAAKWASVYLGDWTKESLWLVNWMSLVQGVSQDRIEQSMERFGFAKNDRKKVIASLSVRSISDKLAVRSLTNGEVFEILHPLSLEELVFLYAWESKPSIRQYVRHYLLKWRHLKLQITGEDLKEAGILPGKNYPAVLGRVFAALLEGQCMTRAEQLKCLRSLLR